jgi:hypothetical protein
MGSLEESPFNLGQTCQDVLSYTELEMQLCLGGEARISCALPTSSLDPYITSQPSSQLTVLGCSSLRAPFSFVELGELQNLLYFCTICFGAMSFCMSE